MVVGRSLITQVTRVIWYNRDVCRHVNEITVIEIQELVVQVKPEVVLFCHVVSKHPRSGATTGAVSTSSTFGDVSEDVGTHKRKKCFTLPSYLRDMYFINWRVIYHNNISLPRAPGLLLQVRTDGKATYGNFTHCSQFNVNYLANYSSSILRTDTLLAFKCLTRLAIKFLVDASSHSGGSLCEPFKNPYATYFTDS